MRAWTVDQPGPLAGRPLRFGERPDPVPAADELLLEVRCCGICRTDLHVATGDLAVRRRPVVPGHQVVATVLARGAAVDPAAPGLAVGDRVGVAWLHRTCGVCRYCLSGRENLCPAAAFTGWTVDGGFAERLVAPAGFVYPLPPGLDDFAAAPLLCAGIIGWRALARTGLPWTTTVASLPSPAVRPLAGAVGPSGTRPGAGPETNAEAEPGGGATAGAPPGQPAATADRPWAGVRLGLYGFGAAGHVAIQIARARGAEVYVATRDRKRHQALAVELGASWVGDTMATPPVALDAGVVFAPAGEIVPTALGHLAPGGVLVLGGIHMSDLPSFPYRLLWEERELRSVANNTRADGVAFLAEAARVGVRTHVERFPFEAADRALAALAGDGVRGAAVLAVTAPGTPTTTPRAP
jgi:propanol-preferring alcohol dehydrogenase